MGNRVTATMSLAPFDAAELAASEAGQRLLTAIAKHGFNEESTSVESGVAVWEGVDYEANYGTAALDGTGYGSTDFPGLAAKAGIWCLVSDEGGLDEWPQHHTVYRPDGQGWSYYGNAASRVVVDRVELDTLVAEGGIEAIQRHLIMGERGLVDWVVASAGAGEDVAAKRRDTQAGRVVAAAHWMTPSVGLVALAGDESEIVRRNVAWNRSTPPGVLAKLAERDEDKAPDPDTDEALDADEESGWEPAS